MRTTCPGCGKTVCVEPNGKMEKHCGTPSSSRNHVCMGSGKPWNKRPGSTRTASGNRRWNARKQESLL